MKYDSKYCAKQMMVKLQRYRETIIEISERWTVAPKT